MTGTIELHSDSLEVEVDAGRGADILSLRHLPSGIDVLFSTPWRARADALRAGQPSAFASDSQAAWLEAYRGGWQTLAPNAGPTREMAGAPVGYHGELSTIPWRVHQTDAASATLSTELFSLPLAVERTLTVDGAALTIVDTLSNRSPVPIELDWVSHPAIGGDFLTGRCTIDTNARSFTRDADGVSSEWPWSGDQRLDLIPGPGQSRAIFGWLSNFETHSASIVNHDLHLAIRLDWDGDQLPYAWLWQEFESSPGFPWFRRARVMAIEPSSTQTGGPHRRSVLLLEPGARRRIPLTVSIESTGAQT